MLLRCVNLRVGQICCVRMVYTGGLQALLLRAQWLALQRNILLQQHLERLHGALRLCDDRGTAVRKQIDSHVTRVKEDEDLVEEDGGKPGPSMYNAGACACVAF